ncbi:MAG: LysM peptidoglycan-binding domain-containing protein, partial [Gammaproteobacteria bacterium]|nr:LysM peptidoglycan-binding domain-containing protein [Gammaproteobacteria bacterium]
KVVHLHDGFRSKSVPAAMDDLELRHKQEASILKVVSRINKSDKGSSGNDRARVVAAVLFVASIILGLSHLGWLPGENEAVFPTIQLLEPVTPLEVDIEKPEVNTETSMENTAVPETTVEIDEGHSALGGLALEKTQTAVDHAQEFNEPDTESIVHSTQALAPMPEVPAPVQADLASPVAPTWNTHHIVWGDTLWHISARYLKDPFRYPDLARWNKIKNPDLIYAGDQLKYKTE